MISAGLPAYLCLVARTAKDCHSPSSTWEGIFRSLYCAGSDTRSNRPPTGKPWGRTSS